MTNVVADLRSDNDEIGIIVPKKMFNKHSRRIVDRKELLALITGIVENEHLSPSEIAEAIESLMINFRVMSALVAFEESQNQ